MQLVHNDTFGPIDDEFATTQHDGNIAQVNLFLNRFIFGQTQPDSERSSVSQSELTAFVRSVTGFAKFVAEIFQSDLLIVAFHWENFFKHTFDPVVLTFFRIAAELQKRMVADGLDLG